MIQFARAEIQGVSFELPLRNGKSLCSFRNPQQEAERWLKNIGRIPTSTIYVVGLGAGFHVDLLLNSFSGKVFVIEPEIALTERYRQTHAPNARLEIASLEGQSQTLATWIGDCSTSRNMIVDFRPSWVDAEDTYSQVRALLTGRSMESIQLQKAVDGLRGISLHALPQDRLISARDIVDSFQTQSFSEEQKLWLCLQELLK